MSAGSHRRRDLLVSLGVLAAILLLLSAYAQTWPPAVVVESDSMMHPHHPPGWGRIGTIDPGDLVMVKKVASASDVALWVQDGPAHYGEPGDVIIYRPDGSTTATPIIHRAITYIEVSGTGSATTYRVTWQNGDTLRFDSSGIYLPALGIDEPLYTPSDGWKPTHSGFLTKGDNPDTNPRPDQVGNAPLSSLVKPSWIEGKAVGELPWFGLIKLAVASTLNVRNPPADWVRIGNAFAPRDLWLSLLVSLTALVLAPLSWDVHRAWRRVQDEGIDPREPLRRFPARVAALRARFLDHGGDGPREPLDGSDGAPPSRAAFRVVTSGGEPPAREPRPEEGPAPARASFQVMRRARSGEEDEDEDAAPMGNGDDGDDASATSAGDD